LNLAEYVGLPGQPYLLREVKQEVKLTTVIIRRINAAILFFMCRDFLFDGLVYWIFCKYKLNLSGLKCFNEGFTGF
jgi:hypothetical protein